MTARLRRQHAVVAEIAADLGLTLDAPLTTVETLKNGSVAVVATLAPVAGRTEAEELLARSALHAALLDALPHADVHVLARPPLSATTNAVPGAAPTAKSAAFPATKASEWVRLQSACVHEWACQAAVTMAHAACERVIDSLPWRDAAGMRLRIPSVVRTTVDNMVRGAFDPLMSAGNVDALLPPLGGVLVPYDLEAVCAEATGALGRPPASQLELVEMAYTLTCGGAARKPATRLLCEALFAL